MRTTKQKLSIVIPCFQSVNNIPELQAGLEHLKSSIPDDIEMEIVIVDDGSTDGSYDALLRMKESIGENVVIVKLSGNFGSYPAFLAGLHFATGDCFVQLHADLQDPPDQIPNMIALWRKGYKLVIGQRVDREETGIYKILANLYHQIIKKIAMPYIPEGGYDLILFDRQLRDEVVKMNESNINLVYLISWLRFKYITVPVVRKKRVIGESQWTFSRRVKLVMDSIVSFSYFPIRLLTFSALLSLAVWIIISVMAFTNFIELSWFEWLIYSTLNGIFVSISVIAEYLWRTLEAAKKRPPFVVDEIIR